MDKKRTRENYKGKHILANNVSTETDTWESGINNNVLLFGPSGAGKTRHYVKPNILNAHESMIISDTKGTLYGELAPVLRKRGYEIFNINFTDLTTGSGYNPLDFVRCNKEDGGCVEQDILSLSRCLVKDTSLNDPFWYDAARQYLSCFIGYIKEAVPPEKQTPEYIMELLSLMDSGEFKAMMLELKKMNPKSTTAKRYESFMDNTTSIRMHSSIKGILSSYLDPLCFKEALALYDNPNKIDFSMLGKKKTAVFLTISDIDRSMDALANAFMTQALQVLLRSADKNPNGMLDIPVRLYLDDFATNLYIPDFDKIISVIRSREIYVSVILQSITQLYSLYGNSRAKTILNNCDQQLYLGGQDVDTAQYISIKADRNLSTILGMPLGKLYLFVRGSAPLLTEKYDAASYEAAMANQSFECECVV